MSHTRTAAVQGMLKWAAGILMILAWGAIGLWGAPGPSGTFTYVTDSTGRKAGAGAVVTITFTPANGSAVVNAVKPGETLTDNGQFHVNGSLISITLPQIGITVTNQPFSLTGQILVLPFKLFSPGAGTSTWTGGNTAGGHNPATGTGPGPAKGQGTIIPGTPDDNPPGTDPGEPPAPGTNPPVPTPPDGPQPPGGPPPPPPSNPSTPQPGPSNPPPPSKPKTPPVADPFFNIPSPGTGGKDIVFGCDGSRWSIPNVCRVKNPHQPINCGTGCMMTQPTKTKALNIQSFVSEYNMAVFPDQKGSSPGALLGLALAARVPGGGTGEALIKQIVGSFYSVFDPNVVAQMTTNKPDEDADLDAGFGGKFVLTVYTPALQELSPAGLVNTIGHEMVHLEQRQRGLPISTIRGELGAKDSLFELEASSWESGARNFHWKIGFSKVAGSVTRDEQLKSAAVMACREWQAVNRIAALPSGAKDELATWLDQNSWTKQVWLPRHHDWKTMAPFASSTIKFNGAGYNGNQVDCNGIVGP